MSDCPTKRNIALAEEVAVDIERANAVLHDVAVELRLMGLRGRVAQLHTRALALKRDVARWTETATEESQRQATIEELLALHETIKRERGKRR